MRRIALLALMPLLAACTAPPQIAWPEGASADPPVLLPLSEIYPPAPSPDPGPALQARANALRASLGLEP